MRAAEQGHCEAIRWFALDRPRAGAIPIVCDEGTLRAAKESSESPLFYASPADAADPGITVPLYEYLSGDGQPTIYDVNGNLEIAGYQRCPEPLCRVWPSPYLAPVK